MANIIDIDSRMPHYYITALDGSVHVISLLVLMRIATGHMEISDLEDWEKIIPRIVGEWMQFKKDEQ